MIKKNDKRTWQDTSKVLELIKHAGKNIAIITHVNPDGDAIGSSLGLKKVFHNMGHSCSVISPNTFPDFLKWMPGSNTILIYNEEPEKAAHIIKHSDIIISVDFNTLKRVEQFRDAVERSLAYKLLIDHHPDPDLFSDCSISDTSLSSTAEIIYQFIASSGLKKFMDTDVAICLFTGIITDTGCFSYNSSERNTYDVVAELLDYNINKDKIYYLLYDNFSCNRMRLLGYSLNEKMEIIPECRTALIWLTREELQRYHYQIGDSEGFVNYPLSIEGIRFSAFFIEREDHIKISFRSKGNFAVNRFAEKYFNGGGHMNASGAESYDTMDKTLRHFREMLFLNKDSLVDYEI